MQKTGPDQPKAAPHTSPAPSTLDGCCSEERGYQQIRVRQDTLENWAKNNPTLASGEFGYVIGSTDAGKFLKIGDGTLPWSALPWIAATGSSGPSGPAGADGHSVAVYGPSQLPPSPANTSLYKGDLWLSDGSYPAGGSFDPSLVTPGAKGDKGDPGTAATIVAVSTTTTAPGTDANVVNAGTATSAQLRFFIPRGDTGAQGIQGPAGNAGPQGPAGDTLKVSGAVANEAALPAKPLNLAVYITKDDAHLHIYDPASAAAKPDGYVDLGAIAGPAGAAMFMSPAVANAAALPATGADGQCVMTLDDGHLHSWNPSTKTWVDAGQIRGPVGSGVSNGTEDGQVLVWRDASYTWHPEQFDLYHLSNCQLDPSTALADGDVLTWDEDVGVWTNAPVPPPNSISYIVGQTIICALTEAEFKAALGAEGNNWVLLDGRDVTGSKWAALTGKTKLNGGSNTDRHMDFGVDMHIYIKIN